MIVQFWATSTVLAVCVAVATRVCLSFNIAHSMTQRYPLRMANQNIKSLLLPLQATITAAQAEVVHEPCDVAVFGGGFGGLYTALTLSRLAKQSGRSLDVVLVEPSHTFVFLPLLYDLTVGTATELEVCPLYTDLLRGTGVRHVRASLQSLTASTAKHANQAEIITETSSTSSILKFAAAVVAVGASPQSMLESIPGAATYAHPFYTAPDAKRLRRLLNRLDEEKQSDDDTGSDSGDIGRIAVVGGGYGGVELAASVARRLPWCNVTLLSRGPPMAGTRAEPVVQAALQSLGVAVEECSVTALKAAERTTSASSNGGTNGKVIVERTQWGSIEAVTDDAADKPWDAVLWTAGSSPSEPVASGKCVGLVQSPSGRLAVDAALRCRLSAEQESLSPKASCIWALGDCAEIVIPCDTKKQVALPKTAQVAIQQADTVAANIWGQLCEPGASTPDRAFVYQDLGSMLTLGGPNAAVLAPKDGMFAPLFAPALDTANRVLSLADEVLSTLGRLPVVEQLGLPVNPASLGLSLSSHGLAAAGLQQGDAPGTWAGTLSGAARRTIYAARMPTNQQRAVSLFSAAIATAAALAREASSDRIQK